MPRKGQFVSRDKLAQMFSLFFKLCAEHALYPSPALARAIAKWEAMVSSVKPAR